MNRTLGVVVAAVFLAVHVARASATAAPTTRPNIVVILADDLGISDLGCYGSEIATPNLDKLAAGGVKFSQFYNTARCCPTRASLLTGLYPHQAGVGHMTAHSFENHPGYQNSLARGDVKTIAETLKPAGYATYMTGKWHVTRNDLPRGPKDNWPRRRGFDRFYGTIRGGGSYYDPATLVRDEQPITPENDAEYKPAAGPYYYTDAIADQSARFIAEHAEKSAAADGKPFFMYVAFTAPHWPLHAPADAVAKYKGKYDAGYEPVRAARFEKMKRLGLIDATARLSPAPLKWADQPHKEWEARCMEVYAAQIELMDAGIGRIIAALEKSGQLDNTLVLFLADNGACAEKMGRDVHADRANAPTSQPRGPDRIQIAVLPRYTRDGRPIRDGHIAMPGPDDSYVAYGKGWANVSNTPLREYKHWVHEGGISSPLIAHWPRGIQPRDGNGGGGDAGRGASGWERQPAHLVDIMATCVELSGAEPPKNLQGVSLTRAFDAKPLDRKQPIFWEHEGNRAVRDGKWKLVAKGKAGPWELYDIDADRGELHDRAADQPERAKAMAAAWQKWAEASQVLPLDPWGTAPKE